MVYHALAAVADRSHGIRTQVSRSHSGEPPCGARRDLIFTAEARHEIVNALSAIHLYAEAIRLRATQETSNASIIASSAANIRSQAELIWRILEEVQNPTAGPSAPAE